MSLSKLIRDRLTTVFPDAEIELTDTGGGDHWHLVITSSHLTGLKRVRQHQAIYKPLHDLIQSNKIHALQITVK